MEALTDGGKMPFVTLILIKPFIGQNRYDAINASGNWAKYESAAAKIIRDETGYSIPVSEDDRPDWVDNVAAWIIDYLALPIIPGDSEGEVERITNNYKLALKLMAKYRKTPSEDGVTATNENVNCGAYEQEDEW